MLTTRLRGRRLSGNVVVLGLLLVWFVTLAPTAIGGPTAYNEVVGHSMDGTYQSGDLVITREQGGYEVGDVVTFRAAGGLVIHRIIGGDGSRGYTLQGDNNPAPDPWHPGEEDVIGKAWIHLPGTAWILRLPREPWFAGVFAGLLTLVVLGWDSRPRVRHDEQIGEVPPRQGASVATEAAS